MSLSSWTHFIATLLSIAGLAVLVTLASIKGTAIHVISFSIFGAALILLYFASTLYHFLSPLHPKKDLFQTIDHSMIFVLIAGTYTPLALIILTPAWGWSMFGVIWGLALSGIFIKIFRLKIAGWLSTIFYILMGWLIVIAFSPLSGALSLEAFFWLTLGGIFYTIGTVFFGLDKVFPKQSWWSYHDIFHVFVMLGSGSHFWFMLKFAL